METWILYALLAALGFSITNFMSRIIQMDALTFTMIQLIVAGVILLPFMKTLPSSKTTIAWVVVSGILLGIACVLNVLALKAAPNPGFVTALGGLTTVLMYVFSFIFLGIGLTPIKLIGSVLVLLGVVLVAI